MKFKRIRSRMLAFILPVIAVAYIIMMLVSVITCRNIVSAQINETMSAQLSAIDGDISEYLDSVSNLSTAIADFVEVSYKTTDWDTYEAALTNLIAENEIVLGSGFWFEPNAYDASEKYYGPYVYKDGGSTVTTWDYSNAEYDYFSQEYYTLAKESTVAVFTDPYYDPTSNTIMSSCSCPIIVNGKFIGCVTVDIEITAIKNIADSIKVGQTGYGVLCTNSGTLIGGVDDETIAAEMNIADYAPLAPLAGSVIGATGPGVGSFVLNGSDENVFFDKIDETNWTIILIMSQEELASAMKPLKNTMFLITVVTLAFVVLVIIRQVNVITRSIVKVQEFSSELSEGNFTVNEIQTKETDEIGTMSNALNNMFQKNRSVIQNIAGKATDIDESSQKLKSAADKLNEQFRDIEKYMYEVNDAMSGTSAATQEVNASAEEVFSNVNVLADEAESCRTLAEDIQTRAASIEKESQTACDSAVSLSKKFEEQLSVSIENSGVVANISELATVISNIAEQINLLSLNASIEAARAGEAGKGFAVVATEIGSLAGDTASAVKSIQETISDVRGAFTDLTNNATELLSFLQDTVTPDYEKFVTVARQYGDDAKSFADASNDIANKSENIRIIMDEVTAAIQSVAESTNETTDTSSRVLSAVEEVGIDVATVSDMSLEQEEIAENLNEVVSNFKL